MLLLNLINLKNLKNNTENMRDTYVKDIVIGETTYQKTDTLTIEANTDVIINFNAHAESLQGFFNKNSDANVVNIKSIDFSHFI